MTAETGGCHEKKHEQTEQKWQRNQRRQEEQTQNQQQRGNDRTHAGQRLVVRSDHIRMATVWDSVSVPRFPALSEDRKADVCVVGAGIAGLSIAYTLLREGKSVIVLDANKLGRGETGVTSAHLSNGLDDRYYAIEKVHGEAGARLAADSHTDAINRIEQIAANENIACEFKRVDGYLFSANKHNLRELETEFEAVRRAGIPITWEEKAPWASYDTGRCIRFPNQGQFHPLKYLFGLAHLIKKLGGEIYLKTRAMEFEGGANAKVSTDKGFAVYADHIVLATNVPINDRVVVHTKQAAYRTYVLGFNIKPGSVYPGLFWDTAEPYHYIRTERNPENPEKDILIIGGEDHKVGQAANYDTIYKHLESWARKRFPAAESIAYKWSGQIIEPIDGLAYIGRNPFDHKNVYIVTGDSGNGLTHGTIAGKLIPDLIMGRNNPWEALYSPSRIHARAVGELLKENLNVVPQYGDWATPGEAESEDDIKPGTGKIIRRGLQKVAAYRDKEGKLTECSAVCPHMAGIVRWNSIEESWDCPCHGSRFSPEGDVLNGPANVGLKAFSPQASKSS